MDDIQKIIDILGLTPAFAGRGLFRLQLPSPRQGGRTGHGLGHLLHAHRAGVFPPAPLCTDEVYHFYSGDPVELLERCPTAPAG